MKRSYISFLVLAVLLTVWSTVAAAQATITSISPTTIQVGGSLTISGSGFGASQGLSNSISFTGVPASPRIVASSWTATKIVVAVPSSAISGTVSVVVSSRASNTIPFTVTPSVSNVTPAAALPGTQVTVVGTGFGNTQAIGSSSIAFNGVSVVPSTWTSTSIVLTVPNNATSGSVIVTVAGQSSSNSVVFTPIPSIATISPAQAAAGTQVTISGNSFGTAQGSSSVIFNGVAAPVINWNNSTLQAIVPNTSTGPVVVHVNGVSSNSTAFTVSPGIISISPNPGMAGSPVTISGTAFGSPQGSSNVTFNGLGAVVTNWSNSAVVAIVPPNVTAGPVQVTVSGMASNGVVFSLPQPYNFAISYAPDGAILGVNDSVNGAWNYGYDDFNRLATANRTDVPTGLSFQYDQYSNRWQQNVTAGTAGSSQMTFNPAPTASRTGNCYHPAGLNNQPSGYCFDAAGNLLGDAVHTYTYDAENRVISVDAGQTATYSYNGTGQRVSKGTGASASEFLYGLDGNLITEVSGSGSWIRGEIYSARKHVGTYRDGTTYFTQTDWLGTERARVYFNGNLFRICTNLPFGDGLNCSGPSDPSPDHFTGKERDAESGFDYFGARYYASTMGRFTSPDWSARPEAIPYANISDPQTLNLYAYVGNSPISKRDLDGHWMPWEHVSITQLAYDRAGLRRDQSVIIAVRNVDGGGHNPYWAPLIHHSAFTNAQDAAGSQADHFLRNAGQSQMGAYNDGMSRIRKNADAARAALVSGDLNAYAAAMGGAGHAIQDSFAHTDREGGNGAIFHIQCYNCSGTEMDHQHPEFSIGASEAEYSTDATQSMFSPQAQGSVDATADFLTLMRGAGYLTDAEFGQRMQSYENKWFQQELPK
jgi:RHS repeat-associated protein